MKRKIIITLLAFALSFSTTGCITIEKDTDKKVEKNQNEEPKEKVYIEESQVADLFASPNDFEEKYVELSGQLLDNPEKVDDVFAMQVWTDPINDEQSFVVYCKNDCGIKANDYVKVNGKIIGAFDGESIIGTQLSVPAIETDLVEKISYKDIYAPTLKEFIPQNSEISQKGLTLKIDKIEYAESETRVYVTETSTLANTCSIFTYDIKIVQDGKQIAQDDVSDSAYHNDYPELAYDLLPGATSSGVLLFPPIDSDKNLQIYADAFTEEDIEFDTFVFDIKLQ